MTTNLQGVTQGFLKLSEELAEKLSPKGSAKPKPNVPPDASDIKRFDCAGLTLSPEAMAIFSRSEE